MGYLGQISIPLDDEEKEEMGQVDVLFLPVGLQTLTVDQMNQTAADAQGQVSSFPSTTRRPSRATLPLRSLDAYLAGTHLPVRRFDSDEIALTRDALPTTPTVYVLTSP